jgi:tRNA pseudouridine38-40 synthase
MLIGRNDFESFSEKSEEQTSTVVKVETAQILQTESLILFRIGASHFLWKMVRRIVGALVEVGRENLSLKQFEALLQSYSNEPAAWTAPPSGLFLEKVLYRGDKPPEKIEPAFSIRER